MKNCLSQIKKCKRIAIMGGTFDPVHNGHLVAAEAVRKEFNIEKVLFIPSGKPPHKLDSDVTNNEHRYLMTAIATASNSNFFTSRIEIDREGRSYTVDTIKEIRSFCKNEIQIYFITGADAITQILTWKDAEYLLGLCNFVAVTRPGYDISVLSEHINKVMKKYKSKLFFLEIPSLSISSTDIRNRVSMDKPIKYLLPLEVEEYIYKFQLYQIGKFDITEHSIIKKYLKNTLTDKRYTHTMGVAVEAVKLSQFYGYDKERAYVAGLLHDCAKDISDDKKKKMAKEFGIKCDEIMEKQPDLIHSFLGAEIAKKEFNIKDPEILDAIRYHTTGRKNMGLLEKIIFLADAIEPGREPSEELTKLRVIAFKDIDHAMVECLKSQINFTIERKRQVHFLGVQALEYYNDSYGEI